MRSLQLYFPSFSDPIPDGTGNLSNQPNAKSTYLSEVGNTSSDGSSATVSSSPQENPDAQDTGYEANVSQDTRVASKGHDSAVLSGFQAFSWGKSQNHSYPSPPATISKHIWKGRCETNRREVLILRTTVLTIFSLCRYASF